jgi:hypothetical protein
MHPINDLKFYEARGFSVQFDTVKKQAGSGPSAYLASVSFTARQVQTVANEVRTICKANPDAHVDDVIERLAPNVDAGDRFICSFDFRKAVRKAVTGRAR